MNTRMRSYPFVHIRDYDVEAPNFEYRIVEYDKVEYFVFYCPKCQSYHTINITPNEYSTCYSYEYVAAIDIRAKGSAWTGINYKNENNVYCTNVALTRIQGLWSAPNDLVVHLCLCAYIIKNGEIKYYYTTLVCPNTKEVITYTDESEATPKPDPEDPDDPGVDIPSDPGIEDPNENSMPPVIQQDMADVEAYQHKQFLIQFYAYDVDGYINEFYFSITGGGTWGRFKPTYIGNSVYANIFLFGDLGEYDCKIKVVDNVGLSAESNTFKITVLPPISNPTSPNPPNVSNSDYIILYDKNSNEFESNGLGILKDCIECKVYNELNGSYEVELYYPVNTKFDDYLLDTEYIIKCNVDNNSNSQLFRIYDSEYIMEDNIIIVRGRHITNDLKDDFVEGVSVMSTSCKNATQAVISCSTGVCKKKFLVSSDIETKKKFSISRSNTLEALIGVEGSIFDVYGSGNTSIFRDNFNLNISNTENDRGVNISYRKNMIGFKRKISTDNVITKIYPYATTDYGKVIRLSEKFIISPNANKYVTEKIKAVEFTGDILSEDDLRNVSKDYFEKNQIDIPNINYEVDFALLYKNNADFSSLETVCLGDTVTVNDERIGLSVKAKVVEIIYNPLSKKYEKIELGSFKNEHRMSKKNDYNSIRKIVKTM